MRKVLKEFGIVPKNIEIYYQAFTHQTFANEENLNYNYQRLEFVGDALIDSFVGMYLFNNYPNINEGQMTLLRASCVNKEALAEFSRQLRLGEILRVGNKSENLRKSEAILSDVFESFCAAVFLDQGKIGLISILEATVYKLLNQMSTQELKDPKTLLQELLQTESRASIKYISTGDRNNYKSTVKHDGLPFGSGEGNSKKEAERNAAKNALEKLKGDK